jgi:uncharacterized protein (TIGR02466 family)
LDFCPSYGRDFPAVFFCALRFDALRGGGYTGRMAELKTLFATTIYRAELEDATLLAELDAACRSLAEDDEAGQAWCRRHGYPGYTSYSSLADLPWRIPAFRTLVRQIDRHVAGFAKVLEFDLGRRRLTLDGIWVNVLPKGGSHPGHIHPLSVVSGTFYVATPKGASALKFEDPRLGLMMAAPPRKAKAAPERQAFVSEAPRPGTILLWESWLRHEVPRNNSQEERISVSFNYRW